MKQITKQEVETYFSKIKNYKTKDIDLFISEALKNKDDVSLLKPYLLEQRTYHRIYFYVNLIPMKTLEERLSFLLKHQKYLQDWWQVDQCIRFLYKKGKFNTFFKFCQKHYHSKNPFLTRLCIVGFISGYQKEDHMKEILSLLEPSEVYYILMGQAWLLCDLYIFHQEETFKYLKNCPLTKPTVLKAIQKICDSFRIDEEGKNLAKSLRSYYH